MSDESAAAAAAAAVIEDVQAEVQAEHQAVEQPAEQEPLEATVGSYDPELPAEVAALLEDDEPAEQEPAAEAEDYWGAAEVDDDVERLRRENAELRKRQEFLEKQTQIQRRKDVKTEIETYFPFADAETISQAASSRREALRIAKEQHTQAKRGADKVLAHVDALVDEKVAEREKALQEKWGQPIGGPGEAVSNIAAKADVNAGIQNARTLHERILAKMRAGQVPGEITSLAEGGE